jgi:hypothetical protein
MHINTLKNNETGFEAGFATSSPKDCWGTHPASDQVEAFGSTLPYYDFVRLMPQLMGDGYFRVMTVPKDRDSDQ